MLQFLQDERIDIDVGLRYRRSIVFPLFFHVESEIRAHDPAGFLGKISGGREIRGRLHERALYLRAFEKAMKKGYTPWRNWPGGFA